jgi:hypothetical protein
MAGITIPTRETLQLVKAEFLALPKSVQTSIEHEVSALEGLIRGAVLDLLPPLPTGLSTLLSTASHGEYVTPQAFYASFPTTGYYALPPISHQ